VENGYCPAAAFRSTQRCSYDFIHQYLSGDRGSQISKTKPISTIWSKGDSVPNKSFVTAGRLFGLLPRAIKGLATPIAAVSAVFASLTALGVYEGEQNRQIFERKAHAYTVIHNYSNYIAAKFAMRPCLSALQTLDKEELSDILFYNRTEHFQYDPQRHKPLEACLSDSPLGSDQTWSLNATRSVRYDVIRDLHAFDDALLSFRYDVGDRRILCENLIGYVRIWNEFYRKLIEIKFIDDENYPSVKYFVEMVERQESCPPPSREHSTGKWVFESYARFLNWLFRAQNST
jgi:hypothetical protein